MVKRWGPEALLPFSPTGANAELQAVEVAGKPDIPVCCISGTIRLPRLSIMFLFSIRMHRRIVRMVTGAVAQAG
eukprot:SAG31_NODE_1132_length_9746_cov_6.720639_3_plen_74_part_00